MSTASQRILIVDDERQIRTILSTILADEGYTVKTAESGKEALTVVDGFDPELILMDQNMPGIDGIETMSRLREREPGRTIIILTAFGSIPLAVEAMKKGAYDYIAKPFDNEELLLIVRRALERSRLTEEVTNLRKQLGEQYRFENIIGVSPKMQRLFEQMRRVCDTDATVFIQGESGTGKELVAKAIHYCSKRKDRQLISVNCGAIPVNLIESEFFGHERGAFTDARERKAGKLEQADRGTLFLDEIGELPPDAQVKLLRVLEDKTVTLIGGREAITVDVRIIAATNKNLEQEVAKGNFRLDLFYRFNIFPIIVPPLRDHPEDIPLLAEHFLEKYNRLLGLHIRSISRAAIKSMETYSWPGNVRSTV
jgi:DNA-binding NtrC family response regulator